MGETLVRFDGVQEMIIKKLTGLGIYKTKSEVIRAGILGLGKEYDLIGDIKQIEDELAIRKMQKISEDEAKGKIRIYTEDEVKKKYGFK